MKSIDTVPAWYWPDGVPRYQSPPRSTVYKAALERWARRTPDNIALDHNGTRITYRNLDERVKRTSAWMRQVSCDRRDDGHSFRVAVVGTQTIESAVAILAALHAGADTLLLDPNISGAELYSLLASFGCRLLVVNNKARLGGDWYTADFQELSLAAKQHSVTADSTSQLQTGRLGFRWGSAVVLQPNAGLLGWSLAFRDFAMLDKNELFIVAQPFSTWEGIIGLLAPLAVGATAILHHGSLADVAISKHVTGCWLDWTQAEAIVSEMNVAQRRADLNWVYISVDSPFSVRKRRRLERSIGSEILTILGTPVTGPVSGSPRTWHIDEAVGTPTTGVDIYPVNSTGVRLADVSWPLLASARVGVKSTLVVPEISIEGTAPGRFISDGIFDTGTLGAVDANGFLYLV
jgi:acyl-coenzyme A synthetase/AMP-(fatty) acid ligase